MSKDPAQILRVNCPCLVIGLVAQCSEKFARACVYRFEGYRLGGLGVDANERARPECLSLVEGEALLRRHDEIDQAVRAAQLSFPGEP